MKPTINDYLISAIEIQEPLSGRHTAQVSIALSSADAAPLTVGEVATIDLDSNTWSMHTKNIYSANGFWHASLVAAPNLEKRISGRQYQDIERNIIIADILRDAGIEAGIIDAPGHFYRYVRRNAQASTTLTDALFRADREDEVREWRTTRDGKLNVAEPLWKQHPTQMTTLGKHGEGNRFILEFDPSLAAGMVVELDLQPFEVRALRVAHILTEHEARTFVWGAK